MIIIFTLLLLMMMIQEKSCWSERRSGLRLRRELVLKALKMLLAEQRHHGLRFGDGKRREGAVERKPVFLGRQMRVICLAWCVDDDSSPVFENGNASFWVVIVVC